MNQRRVTVLVVQDAGLRQAGIRAQLDASARATVVGQADNQPEALRLQRRCRPDVVLIDGLAHRVDVRQLTEIIAVGSDRPPANILVLVQDLDDTAWELFRSGARGLVKVSGQQNLIAALELVATGHVVLASPRRAVTIDCLPDPPVEAATGPAALTARETDVLRLIGHGFSNAQISRNLRIQETTVKTHVRSLLDKLALQNRVQAAVYAHRVGLVRSSVDLGQ